MSFELIGSVCASLIEKLLSDTNETAVRERQTPTSTSRYMRTDTQIHRHNHKEGKHIDPHADNGMYRYRDLQEEILERHAHRSTDRE